MSAALQLLSRQERVSGTVYALVEASPLGRGVIAVKSKYGKAVHCVTCNSTVCHHAAYVSAQEAADGQRCTACHAVLTDEARCAACGAHQ